MRFIFYFAFITFTLLCIIIAVSNNSLVNFSLEPLPVNIVRIIEKKLILRYDLQDLFNYYIYFKDKPSNYNLIGKNFKKNLMNGLSVWEDPKKNKSNHGDIEGIKQLYKEKGVLKTKYYPECDIHLISLTFYVLNKIRKKDEFKKIFDF